MANDEIIAQALQEEFDTVAAVEASDVAGAVGPVMEKLQVRCLHCLGPKSISFFRK